MSHQSFLKSLPLKRLFLLCSFVSLFALSGTVVSCGGSKTGCPINEKASNTNRKGELSKKAGKSNLFPKKVRKSMGTK